MVVAYFGFVSISSFGYLYQMVLLFLVYLHGQNYVLRNYFYVMFFVFVMVLSVLFGNSYMSTLEQQRVLL